MSTFPGDIYVKNARKAFGVTKALDDCSFSAFFGEIHAVIGGNGCGKSTLAKVMSGVLPIDTGKVSIMGHHPTSPAEARAIGVTTVFQEVLVADEATVTDNLFVGVDGFFSKAMSEKEKQQKARAMMSELAGENVDPLTPAGSLPLSIKAWITIARGLLCEPKVLILDESSAALDFDSTERLFDKMRELRDRGAAILIVTHRIAELIRISDRCTVMRDGKDVGVLEKAEITEENLLRLMTGRTQNKKSAVGDAHQTTSQELMLRSRKMKVWEDGEEIDFGLLKGEIIGVTGLDGHGQDDFVRVLAGVNAPTAGLPEVAGEKPGEFEYYRNLDEAKSHNIAFVSGDRKKEGILPNLSIFENMLLPLYKTNTRIPAIRIIDWLSLTDLFDWEVERLGIKTGPRDNLITSLSGGNQQKVMIGRAFANHPKVLVLNDPARGIDLHTKRDLYQQLRDFASEGGSVIYMSSELEEFIGFCSRVLIFRNGSIFEEFVDEQVEGVGILEAMFGRAQRSGQRSRVSPEVMASDANSAPSTKPKPQTSKQTKTISKPVDKVGEADKATTEISDMATYNRSKQDESPSSDKYESASTELSHRYNDKDNSAFESLMDFGEKPLLAHTTDDSGVALSAKTSTQYSADDSRTFESLSANLKAGSQRTPRRDEVVQGDGFTQSDQAAFAGILDEAISFVKEKDNVHSAKQNTSINNSMTTYNDQDDAAFDRLLPDSSRRV